MKNGIILLLSLMSFTAVAQSPLGLWKTFDDKTKEEKSIVEIYQINEKLYGKIVKILDETQADEVCKKCSKSDDRFSQAVEGMEIIRNLTKEGEMWNNGTVLDPENGNVYDCKLWLEDNDTLKLRGYLAFFYRTQTWYRLDRGVD